MTEFFKEALVLTERNVDTRPSNMCLVWQKKSVKNSIAEKNHRWMFWTLHVLDGEKGTLSVPFNLKVLFCIVWYECLIYFKVDLYCICRYKHGKKQDEKFEPTMNMNKKKQWIKTIV